MALSLYNWEIGDANWSSQVITPSITFFYKPSDAIDLHFSTMYATTDDKDDGVKSDLSIAGVSIGYGYCFRLGRNNRITPRLGIDIDYFFLDNDIASNNMNPAIKSDLDIDNSLGLTIGGGVAYLLTDNFYANLDIPYGFLLNGANVKGHDDDMELSRLNIIFGCTRSF